MTSILYLSGPYPGHPEITVSEITGVAEFYKAQAEDAGWRPICPSLWPDTEAWRQGIELIERLDPVLDAVLMLPNWVRDKHAIAEMYNASIRGLKIYIARDEQPIPTVTVHTLCPHYREMHSGIGIRDTCDRNVSQCPAGIRCPIQERVWRQRIG